MNFNQLKNYTQARIGLGHCGPGLPTKVWLEFAYHHAQAVDAVHLPWDKVSTAAQITQLGYQTSSLSTLVGTRSTYLVRPDLGCQLNKDAERLMIDQKITSSSIVLLISQGLSSMALHHHLIPLLSLLLPELTKTQAPLHIFLAENSRVGLIDAMGELSRFALGLVFIGERPGLSAPDSLAIYLTYQPNHSRSNADRNCVSNIRPPFGLSYEQATIKTMYLIKESMRRQLSGVALKEESPLLFD